ncbi:sarcosine oxidase subunit gamma [Gellertiella hungarica]|uniref:Sarcosine oxidase subunit gamma n=1 Tax=Gellertiella hungarica TaxID=1572859 RepID=A0A7W6NJ28_9HYPH|nr:sarcosine oxidase subunit gamma [Gellertiella hungarica]MBB4063039.1 sarcosine oxidase subunit gamma [Gellertiella hungarica]
MSDLMQATRRGVLDGMHGGSAVARLTPAAPASRISLRAPAASVEALSGALAVALPVKPKTSASANGRHALWIGPDEWLIIDESGADLVAEAGKSGALHSAADVSHRNTAVIVSGPKADVAINAGCPQDLSLAIFPVGACSRTLVGKAEVVLYRTAADTFRVEVWRSFAAYVFGLIAEGAEDAAL